MTKPNFFIVGAPKCGTTALSQYLRENDSVFMSLPKEPHYFATDLPNYRRMHNEEEYLALFESATNHQLAIGEASVFYLYSKYAIQNIKKFRDDAKIITMLRNPIDVVYSMHSQLIYSRDEDVLDFSLAWDLNCKRKKGLMIPQFCRDEKILYYDEIAKQGEQVERLLNVFPAEQVKIIYFDDFVNDTGEVYQEVLRFLGLPGDGRDDFQKINQNKHQKISWLANFTERPPRKLLGVIRRLKKIFGIKYLGVLGALRRINVDESNRKPLNVGFKAQILKEYRDDIIKLSQLTKKDLSHWLEIK